MSVRSRLAKLEKSTGVNELKHISIALWNEDDDEETAIQAKLQEEGVSREECKIQIYRICLVDPDGTRQNVE